MDKIKRAVAEKTLFPWDADANVFVWRDPERAQLDELEGEIVGEGDLFRVVKVKVGGVVPPRYFEIRVKEMQ